MTNNAQDDLFDLMSRWDVEVKTIPAYLLRQGTALNRSERHDLMIRRAVLKKAMIELRDAMANMAARYRGIIDGDVISFPIANRLAREMVRTRDESGLPLSS